MADLKPSPRTLGTRQEYTLDQAPFYVHTRLHLAGIEHSHSTYVHVFWEVESKPENPELLGSNASYMLM